MADSENGYSSGRSFCVQSRQRKGPVGVPVKAKTNAGKGHKEEALWERPRGVGRMALWGRAGGIVCACSMFAHVAFQSADYQRLREGFTLLMTQE